MRLAETRVAGCFEISFPVHPDRRGLFVKSFQASMFARCGLDTQFVESFYTISTENVLRGMHLQLPKGDHAKLVYCVAGAVMDVALDLRRGSPAYGLHAVVELDADRHNAVYLPRGVAHGFYVVRAPAILVYHVGSEHDPSLDAGIAWDSFGASWPTRSPILSARDAALPPLVEFDSPFWYAGAGRDSE